jgi:hypothetical protein
MQPRTLLARPSPQLHALVQLFQVDGLLHHGVVGAVHEHLHIVEERQLLAGLVQGAAEVLAVGGPQGGE